MDKERFNVEEHTTLDGRVLDVFPISHIYIHELEKQVKKQKEVIDKAIEYINSSDISIDIRKTNGSLDYVSTNELLGILKEVSE